MNGPRTVAGPLLAASLAMLLLATSGCATRTAPQAREDSTLHRLDAADRAYESGDWKSAAGGYRQVLEADPDNVHVRFRLGVLAYHRGDIDEALRHFERVREIDPEHAGAVYNCAVLKLQQAHRAVARFLALSEHAVIDSDESPDRAARLRPVFEALDRFRSASAR